MKEGDLAVFPAGLPIRTEKRAFQYEIVRRCECGKIDCWVGRLTSGLEMHFQAAKARIVKTKEERAEELLVFGPEDEIVKGRPGEGL